MKAPAGMRFVPPSATVGPHGEAVMRPGGIEVGTGKDRIFIESDQAIVGSHGQTVIRKGAIRAILEKDPFPGSWRD